MSTMKIFPSSTFFMTCLCLWSCRLPAVVARCTSDPVDGVRKAPKPKFNRVLAKAKSAAFEGGIYAASAGFIQVVSLMWLRTIVNYQYRYGATIPAAMKDLYSQGGVPRFYRGLPYAIVLGPLAKFGATAANEGSRVLVQMLSLNNSFEQTYAALLGTGLTIAWRIFLMPLETCKIVLQVDGSRGFEQLMSRVIRGYPSALYQGSAASVLVTATSHYPWFYVYNIMDHTLKKADEVVEVILRSALIGFTASAVSDTASNFLRIIKTVKQSTSSADGIHNRDYASIVKSIYKEGGLVALFTRGLGGRIIANGIQSILFTVLWKVLPLIWSQSNERKKQ